MLHFPKLAEKGAQITYFIYMYKNTKNNLKIMQ